MSPTPLPAGPRVIVLCACGWIVERRRTREATAAAEAHVRDGCEGCDHAWDLIHEDPCQLPARSP